MEYADDENYCEECGVKLIISSKIIIMKKIILKSVPNVKKKDTKNDIYCENCGINLKNFNTYLTEKREEKKQNHSPT